ncbi:MAG TPA: RcnB family protein [Rhizomicrobium sp.]|nr:RcnB family protein [Rhizomicrobium sp.]
MNKKLLISAFALGLAAAAPSAVWAQPDDHHDQGNGKPAAGQGDENKGPKADDSMKGPKADADATGGGMKADTTKTTHRRHGKTTTTTTTNDRTINRDTTNVNTRNVHRTNVDITTYRRTIQAPRHFSIGIYRQPPGYSYRRWGIGERLPSAYYARDYWLTDYAAYGLIAPPGDGYVWVRFGPDAILIDEDTGETVQVVYGVFE